MNFEMRELTPVQLDYAMRLANIIPAFKTTPSGHQRKDVDLAKKMRAKYTIQRETSAETAIPMPQTSSKTGPRTYEWVERASAGIKKKGLSLDRQWNEISWHNKSNRYERLQLLKDDGVNIESLVQGRNSNEKITLAVLAHIATRKPPPLKPSPTLPPPSKTDLPNSSQSASPDTTSGCLEYRPLSSAAYKRKRIIALDTESAGEAQAYIDKNEEPAHKRRCTVALKEYYQAAEMYPQHDAIATQELAERDLPTWKDLRRKVLHDIFRPASSAIHRDATDPHPRARIVIAFPDQVAAEHVPGDFELASTAYDFIVKELRTLATFEDQHGNLTISNPFVLRGGDINIITSVPKRTIIQCNTAGLMGLVARLSKHGLIHRAKPNFDTKGRRIVPRVKFGPWQLSDTTQDMLGKIEEALSLVKGGEEADVLVRWVYRGKTPKDGA